MVMSTGAASDSSADPGAPPTARCSEPSPPVPPLDTDPSVDCEVPPPEANGAEAAPPALSGTTSPLGMQYVPSYFCPGGQGEGPTGPTGSVGFEPPHATASPSVAIHARRDSKIRADPFASGADSIMGDMIEELREKGKGRDRLSRAEAFVVDIARDRGIRATYGARFVLAKPQIAEAHPH